MILLSSFLYLKEPQNFPLLIFWNPFTFLCVECTSLVFDIFFSFTSALTSQSDLWLHSFKCPPLGGSTIVFSYVLILTVISLYFSNGRCYFLKYCRWNEPSGRWWILLNLSSNHLLFVHLMSCFNFIKNKQNVCVFTNVICLSSNSKYNVLQK